MRAKLSTLVVVLTLPIAMAGRCATDAPVIEPGIPTRSNDALCIALDHISPNRGKPGGATIEDIAAALDRDHPVDRVRNVVGDTAGTLKQIDKNNAARAELCGAPVGSVR